jgi:hypothetical protein
VAQEYAHALPPGKMTVLIDSFIEALLAENSIDEVSICVAVAGGKWLIMICCFCPQAAMQCQRLLGENPESWNKWIERFFDDFGEEGRSAIGAVVPSIQLSSSTYNRILLHYMTHDPIKFLSCIRQWSGRADGVIIDDGRGRARGDSLSVGELSLGTADIVTDIVGKQAASSLPIIKPAAASSADTFTSPQYPKPLFDVDAIIAELKVMKLLSRSVGHLFSTSRCFGDNRCTFATCLKRKPGKLSPLTTSLWTV